MNQDTTAIRPGEEIDPVILGRYLRANLPAALGFKAAETNGNLGIEQFSGGHSNLTYLITLDGRQFVLRRPPLGPVAPTAHDMPREYRLLSAIHPHFPLAPEP
ncbi:MAG TPA: phosphotransferase, partial [Blastocatellia bacterium]